MKKKFLLNLILPTTLIAFAAACQQTTSVNTNLATNANSAAHSAMNHDMSAMSEMKSSPDAAAQAYDLQFLDTMIHHHEGAVEMAQMVLANSENPELKRFAAKIIADQQREISEMKNWREKWFAGKPAALNMEMPGMKDSMQMMAADHMKLMNAMKGKDFDLHFLDMMTPHHEGAIVMAKDALQKAEHAEIKTLASQIIAAQNAEIKQMADWKAQWSK